MKTLIIVAHPQRNESVTQTFFRDSLANLDNVTWHPIEPQFDVKEERQLLISNDRIILQFPLYWYSAPALMKKWIDDVFGDTFALAPEFVMEDRELGLVVTTASAGDDFGAGKPEQFTMSEILRPFEAMAKKVKMKYLAPFVVHQFGYQTEEQHEQLLTDYQQYATNSDFQDFSGQTKWFLAQLKNKMNKLDNEYDIIMVQSLYDQLESGQDELKDLQWTLSMIKNAGEDKNGNNGLD